MRRTVKNGDERLNVMQIDTGGKDAALILEIQPAVISASCFLYIFQTKAVMGGVRLGGRQLRESPLGIGLRCIFNQYRCVFCMGM